jgi:hypothetical protein
MVFTKGAPPVLQKFQIKYGWKELEIRKFFSYRNFSRFEIEFELKSKNFYELKFTGKSWNFRF